MTQFNLNDIPPDVKTVEQLNAWSATVLARLYPDKTLVTDTSLENGSPIAELAAQVGYFQVSTFPTNWVWIGRLALDVDISWLEGSKMWSAVKSLGDGVIPASLKEAAGFSGTFGIGNGNTLNSVITDITRAYSTRRLNRNYSGPFYRVRRIEDGAFREFGDETLNAWYKWDDPTQGLTAWLGASSGSVQIWYDQSGGGNDAVASQSSKEPQLRLDAQYDFPYLYFNGSSNCLDFDEIGRSRFVHGLIFEDPNASERDRGFLGHLAYIDFIRGTDRQWLHFNDNHTRYAALGDFWVDGQKVDPRAAVIPTTWTIFTSLPIYNVRLNQIGQDRTSSNYWHGGIAEIVIGTSAEADAIEAQNNTRRSFFEVGIDYLEPDTSTSDDGNSDDSVDDSGDSDTGSSNTEGETDDTDTGETNTGNPSIYLDSYFRDIQGAYSVRKILASYNGPLIQVSRESDGLIRYFAETGGSNSIHVWYAYDDPQLGLAAWLNGSVGKLLRWFNQVVKGDLYPVRSQTFPQTIPSNPHVIPNAFGSLPSISFNGTDQALYNLADLADVPSWSTLHFVAWEDPAATDDDRQLINNLYRGEEKQWYSSRTNTNIRSGITRINGTVINGDTTVMPTVPSVCSIESLAVHPTKYVGVHGIDNADNSFALSNYWHGQIGEILLSLGNTDNVEEARISAANAFGINQ